jgi:hypothetical protein
MVAEQRIHAGMIEACKIVTVADHSCQLSIDGEAPLALHARGDYR